MMRVYVAGPYSSDPEDNTRGAIAVAELERALDAGIPVFTDEGALLRYVRHNP